MADVGSHLNQDSEALFVEIRQRVSDGDDEGAIALASAVAETADGPRVIGRALVSQIGCLFNLGRLDDVPHVLDRAFAVLEGSGEHALLGGVHTMAAHLVASTSLERCVRHLVLGSRYLDRVEEPETLAATGYYNLAVTYSRQGFHAQAMDTAERAYQLGQALGAHPWDHALPEVAVRRATAEDHRGDTESCVALLQDVVRTWRQRTDPARLWRVQGMYLAYASARLAAMGHGVVAERGLLYTDVRGGFEFDDLRLLGAACLAVVDGRPQDALDGLEGQRPHPDTLGAAEIHRVRGLARAALRGTDADDDPNREAARLATMDSDRLRDRLIKATHVELDHEALRWVVGKYASEALTDPLTGLPNRRHFDMRLGGERGRGSTAVLGVIDVDDFKVINTVHGHLGGDLVLKRLASAMMPALRRGDFLARYGGDEFVLILPDTPLDAARQVEARLGQAVAAQDWAGLVAGTPVSITIGWAELGPNSDVTTVLAEADRAMLVKKDQRGSMVGPPRR